jgi:uncharacterized protein
VTRRILDGNVLIALAAVDHVHHEAVVTWFQRSGAEFVTTPTTQGTLLRFLIRNGLATGDAMSVLEAFVGHERHAFMPDDRPFERAFLAGVIGHRQVTDAYLAGMARGSGLLVATLDRGLAALHPDVTELIDA